MILKSALTPIALIALSGSAAGAQVIDWAAPISGDWGTPSNWMGGNVPNTSMEHAVLGLTGAYTVNMDFSHTVGSLFIANSMATLDLPGSRSITLNGPLTNNGTVLLNTTMTGQTTSITYAVDTIIDGSGVIEMYRVPTAQFGGRLTAGNGVTATIGANQIVQGAGHIYGGTTGTFVNNGVVAATDPLAKLDLEGHFVGGSGVYMADGGTLNLAFINGINTQPPTFTNVTFDTMNGGQIIPEGAFTSQDRAPRFDGVTNLGTLSIPNGFVIRLDGPLTNNGTVLVNSNDVSVNSSPLLYFHNSTTIDGVGTIDLGTPTTSAARIGTGVDVVATFGPGQTIQGAGSLSGTFVNNGIINASGDAREISLSGEISFTSTSHLIFDLGGPNIGEYDRMPSFSTDINIGGTLTVNIDDGYEPMFGDLWELIDGGNHTGEFAQVNSPNAPFGLIFKAVYEDDRMYVVLTCEADLNSDGQLDFFDISSFLNAYSSLDPLGDFNNDGAYDFFDISAFLQVFSAGCP